MADDAERRLERIHQALYLWNMIAESTCQPETQYEKGIDEGIKLVATYLLADASRGHFAGQADQVDWTRDISLSDYPDLVEWAQRHTYRSKIHKTGEVDRAIKLADAAFGLGNP